MRISIHRRLLLWFCLSFSALPPLAASASLGLPETIVVDAPPASGAFPLVGEAQPTPLWYDANDYPGVIRAAGDLQADIERVTRQRPALTASRPDARRVVLIGTLGKSAQIDALARSGKLSTHDLAGKWESFVITTIPQPMEGIDEALVIVGSDKRGTIYGIYELSEQLGVSPWYWFADVAPRQRQAAYVLPGRFASGEPVVRYRGIFLNNEAPCLTGWTQEKFGGLNALFYTKVFELLLRMRGNYLWPAMWSSAFNEDDPENPRLADEYGIVMGTSHHEPMMRAHQEWVRRRADYGNGQWNYFTNREAIQRFFREGIARNGKYENLVTIGMRGDGDEGMVSTGDMASDIALLEQIFHDQRRILAEEMQVDPATVPQLWALFTEVQKFYEHGLRPPDDVTLLWTDDNTGNLRRLPTAEERTRSGGAGIYYHFDMHGGPYAFQWINTNPLPKIGEQMNLAAEYGATRIWIVNVGDLKPHELPIEFFVRLGWNPSALGKDQIGPWTRRWAEREFGPDHADEIAEIVSTYAKYNGWRKPEQVKPDTFSPMYYQEAETMLARWQDLAARAEWLYVQMPTAQRDAYYQLVLHPAKACAIVAEMNILAGRNLLYAKQGRTRTNELADRVRELFDEDQAMSDYYNHALAGGKWNHLMDQTHLGQTGWKPPHLDIMPPVSTVRPEAGTRWGASPEGSEGTWPGNYEPAKLPMFDSFQPRRSYVDVFRMGQDPLGDIQIEADQPWILLTPDYEVAAPDQRYWVEIDWAKAPEGVSQGKITVRGKQGRAEFAVPVTKATAAQLADASGRFASLTGPIAMRAQDASRTITAAGASWQKIPDYGRSEAAMGVYPVTTPSVLPPAQAPTLEYDLYLPRAGTYSVTLIIGPVMDFVPDRGMRIAVAMDAQAPQVIDIFADREAQTFLGSAWWEQFTRDGVRYLQATCAVETPGAHTVKISMVDVGIVLEKLIVSDQPLPKTYFGPPPTEPVKATK